MADENILSRRQMLATTGAFLGSSLSAGSSVPSFSVEITLEEDLAKKAEAELDNRSYPAEIMGEFARNSLESLFPAEIMRNTDFVYNDYEPVISGETTEDSLKKWRSISESDHSSKLLITNQKYPDAVGTAEVTSDLFESACAILGEGYDLLKLEEDDWRDKVLLSEYSPKELSHVLNYDPFKTAVAGIHEIGHTASLKHEDGEIYEVDDGIAFSTMASSNPNEYDDPPNIRLSDNIYRSSRFSTSTEEKIIENL